MSLNITRVISKTAIKITCASLYYHKKRFKITCVICGNGYYDYVCNVILQLNEDTNYERKFKLFTESTVKETLERV